MDQEPESKHNKTDPYPLPPLPSFLPSSDIFGLDFLSVHVVFIKAVYVRIFVTILSSSARVGSDSC